MGQLGGAELLIVLAIVVMLFGSTKLPQLARSLGQAKNEFKRGEQDAAHDTSDEVVRTMKDGAR